MHGLRPINADGSPRRVRRDAAAPGSSRTAAAIARDGFLYVVEGKGSTPFGVWAAPILAPGQLGEWRLMASYSPGRTEHMVAEGEGRLFVLGGHEGLTTVDTTLQLQLNAPSMTGRWSSLLDFGASQPIDNLVINGAASRSGTFAARWLCAGSNDVYVFAGETGDVRPGEQRHLGCVGQRMWLGLELDDQRAFPLTRNIDLRNVTDFVAATLPPVSATATPPSVPPRGTSTVTCSGGTGTGYTWRIPTPQAGGGSVGFFDGRYQAGFASSSSSPGPTTRGEPST
ncbi:MAG: hypothetical protein IPJ65_04115 [Archangiaceae bacterium]|nr:hypothetical protein [Archangiaceae bacterium]